MRIPGQLPCALAVVAICVAAGLAGCNEQPSQPTPVCTFTVAPASRTFSGDGGTATVVVTASAASCGWTATATAPWIAISEGTSGTGSGSVTYGVAANSSTAARTGTITVGDAVHTVEQQGRVPVECSYAIAPTSVSLTREPGTGAVTVSAPPTCAWTATSTASWLTVTSGGQGAGNGTIAYAVTRNDDPVARHATIRMADQVFDVTQAGEPQACQYSVSPVQLDPCMPAGTGTVRVTTADGCTWTAQSNVSWLSVGGGSAGSGSGTIDLSYSSNYDAPREGLVMVRWPTPTAGQNVRVSQAGCHYGVSTTAIGFAAAGGSGNFDVVQQSDPTSCGGPLQDACVWTPTTTTPWITLGTTGERKGDDKVTFSVAPNSTSSVRVGTIVVRDQVVQITQAGM